MTTIRTMVTVAILLALTSCSSWKEAKARKQERESYQNPFYLKYLDRGNELDREILARIEALRANPESPRMHNELGALLFERRFTKDACYEFERALHFDKRFYSARYNLAIAEMALGNDGHAKRQLKKVVDQKPGHAEAHFTLGLLYERQGRRDAAIEHYGKAYTIDRDMLKVKRNPRIVESKLVTATLLTLYDSSRERASAKFLDAPQGYLEPVKPTEKVAPEAPDKMILTPGEPASTPPPPQPVK